MVSRNSQIPPAVVGALDKDGEIENITLNEEFAQGTYILVGVPGAYTPVCTITHLPSLIKNAMEYLAMGVDGIYCISDDNPWTLKKWAGDIEGSEAVKFLSDRNRDFLEHCKIRNDLSDLFISGRYGRFYMVIHNNKIIQMRAENSALDTTCTSGECILHDLEMTSLMTGNG